MPMRKPPILIAKVQVGTSILLCLALLVASTATLAGSETVKPVVAIIGTGDMGDSLGLRFAELGYDVIYGSRYPDGEKAQAVTRLTGPRASVTSRRAAAKAGEIVVLAVPWPAMQEVAQNIGSLEGKIVIDVSFPHRQADDGYYEPMLQTSNAEMIQQWNPGARVMKTFALQASYVIDDPDVVGGPVSIPIASDDREAKEQVADIIVAMGLDPVDADDLAEIPETQGEPKGCPGTQQTNELQAVSYLVIHHAERY